MIRMWMFMCLAWMLTAGASYSQSTHSETTQGREAIQRAIPWLESDMASWKENRHCAACHHGPMYLWSIGIAKQQGYKINSTQLQDFTRWLIESDQSRIFPKAKTSQEVVGSTAVNRADALSTVMMGQNNLSQPTIYMLPAVLAMKADDPLRELAWNKLVKHLAEVQHKDGSFVGRDAWRPIFNTPPVLTIQVATWLRSAPKQLALAESNSVLASSLNYLLDHPVDDSQQALVFQILLAKTFQQHQTTGLDLSQLVEQLQMIQRRDGGWAQTSERPSDAFATGQALYALHQAGIDRNHSSVKSGIDFLVKTQLADGTWPMTSRANPEDGMPATNLNPITYAATAWAVVGLLGHVDGPSVVE